MKATPSPQDAATMASLRRSGVVAWPADWPVIGISQWSDQNPRSLDQGDGKNQGDENAERQRDRDRAAAPLALLRCAQDDAGFGGLLIHHEAHANTRPNGVPKC